MEYGTSDRPIGLFPIVYNDFSMLSRSIGAAPLSAPTGRVDLRDHARLTRRSYAKRLGGALTALHLLNRQ
jgi:hypothetical protein